MAKALFTAWFDNFEPFGGLVPNEWHEYSLESLCSLINKGVTPRYTDHSTQIVINQKCVRNNQIDLSLARFHIPKAINDKWLQYGDIIVNSTGTGTLGRTAQVLFIPENLTVDSHITIIRPLKSEYQFYLGLWAMLHEHDFEALATGSTGQTDLPRERLKKMLVLLPNDEVLIRFSSVIKPVFDIMVKRQQENQCLSQIRDALLPRLMSGELDVSELDL